MIIENGEKRGNNLKYLAHIAEDGREQTVKSHLEGTADLAAQFASAFEAEADARLAALLHDMGKYTPGFQKRLRGGPRVDHSTAGAQEAFRRRNLPVALAVAGHHGGIPDAGGYRDSAEESSLLGRIHRPGTVDPVWKQEITVPVGGPPDWLTKDTLANSFYTRMLFSCLVDADFQDTQNFMEGSPAPRGGTVSMEELCQKMRQKAQGFLQKIPDTEVGERRNEVLRACIQRGREWPGGLYSLTVPTGGGKTFSSLAFALEQAVMQHKNRVIYVIPYTSIIDQTVEEFSKILGEENVLAHYAGAEYQLIEPEEMTEAQYRRLLASENWDAPVVVTTAVQFFESLYSNRSSRCRKLHNMANSVVIFDEAQTIPTDYLMPCLYAVAQLVQFYRTTAILCTATQPAFGRLFQKLAPQLSIREICPHTQELYAALRRTTLAELGTISQDVLGERLAAHSQVLCVVNRRSTAQQLYAALPPEGSFCLTTLLCAYDRKRQIAEIRDRLEKGMPCRVVSTSLIEAGVDVDFPVAYREECGLDSLLQTAGRCNREGRNAVAESRVYRFRLDGLGTPPGLSQKVSALHFVARRQPDLASPDAIHAYFTELFQLKDERALDKKQILRDLKEGKDGCALPFAQVAERFQLIETPTRTVYIPRGEGADLCRRLQAGEISRTLLRRLGLYSVDCYAPQFEALDNAGALQLLPDDSAVLTDLSQYSQETGLALDVESGQAIFV